MSTPQYWARVRHVAALLGSDGCTLFPDWFLDCCYEHDIAYRTGRTVEGAPISRASADARLRRCVQQHSPLKAGSPASWVMWLGVRAAIWKRRTFIARPPRQDWPEVTP